MGFLGLFESESIFKFILNITDISPLNPRSAYTQFNIQLVNEKADPPNRTFHKISHGGTTGSVLSAGGYCKKY